MNRFNWGERVAQFLGAMCVLVALISIWPRWEAIFGLLKHKDAAGWAQAIGSLLAIAVAVFVATWQNFKDRSEKSIEENRKEIHYCQICMQMCQAAISVAQAAAVVEKELLKPVSETGVNNFKVHLAKYTSVERIDNIQSSLLALLSKDMSSELMKNIFSIQKNIAIYREAMIIAKIDNKYWEDLDMLNQKNMLENEAWKIHRKLVAYQKRLRARRHH